MNLLTGLGFICLCVAASLFLGCPFNSCFGFLYWIFDFRGWWRKVHEVYQPRRADVETQRRLESQHQVLPE